jgi:hypothetical protein
MRNKRTDLLLNFYQHPVALNSTIFWDITPCSPLNFNLRFGETYRLHLQGRRISQVINQQNQNPACHLLSLWFLARLSLRPWRWRRYVSPKRRLTLNGLHDVISQKIALFITTAVRIPNPTSNSFYYVMVNCCMLCAHQVLQHKRTYTSVAILFHCVK